MSLFVLVAAEHPEVCHLAEARPEGVHGERCIAVHARLAIHPEFELLEHPPPDEHAPQPGAEQG